MQKNPTRKILSAERISAKIRPRADGLRPTLDLELIPFWSNSSTKCGIQFMPRDMDNTGLHLEVLTTPEDTSSRAQYFPGSDLSTLLPVLQQDEKVYELSLTLKGEPPAYNFFCPNEYGPLTDRMNRIKNLVAPGAKFRFIFIGKRGVPGDIRGIQTLWEKTANDLPFRDLFPNATTQGNFRVQAGQLLTEAQRDKKVKENADKMKIARRVNFPDMLTYGTIQGYAQQLERDVENRKTRPHMVKIVLVANKAAFANRRYMGLILNSRVYMTEGDPLSITLAFDDGTADISKEWNGIVLAHNALFPAGIVQVTLTRPWNNEEQAYTDTAEYASVELKDIGATEDDVKRALGQSTKHDVLVTKRGSDKAYFRGMNSLEKLLYEREVGKKRYNARTDLHDLLLANNIDRLPTRDGLARTNLTGDALDNMIDKHTADHRDDQREAMRLLRNAPGGQCLVTGPGGSGKTKFAVDAAMIHYASNSSPLTIQNSKMTGTEPEYEKVFDNTPNPHQVVVAVSMNAPVDAWATKLDEIARAVNPNREPIVVRAHEEKTELDYFGKDTREHRNQKFPSTEPPIMSDNYSQSELEADLEGLFAAKSLWDAYQDSIKKPDKRFKQEKYAVGMWMLRFLGTIPHEVSDKGKRFASLRDFLKIERNTEEGLDAEDKKILEGMTKQLLSLVYAKADFLVTTISNLAEFSLINSINPALAIVDEATRASEAESLGVLVWYQCVILWLADPTQGHVLAFATKDESFLSLSQTPLSLFQRWLLAGMPAALLSRQSRMQAELFDAVNKIFYASRFSSAPSQESRPLAKRFMEFAQSRFHVSKPCLLFDTYDKHQGHAFGNPSKKNRRNAGVVMKVLRILLYEGNFEPQNIVILVPYTAQLHVYHHKLQLMTIEYKKDSSKINPAAIEASTFDSYQGQEKAIVLLDLVIDENMGFLHESTRVCLALTRVQDGLIIVGDLNRLKQGGAPQGKNSGLARYLREVSERGYLVFKKNYGFSLDGDDSAVEL